MTDTIDESFNVWIVILPIAFIFLFMLVGIVLKRRKRLKRKIAAPIIMRYLVLPTGFVYLVLIKIFHFSNDQYTIKITETIFIILLIVFLLNMVDHLLFSDDNVFTKRESLPKLGRDIINAFLVILASTIVFSSVWGYNLGNLLTALGVGSIVVGLALQEPLGNLFNGVSILMDRPFQKGDWVQIGNERGKVVEFNWSSIKIVNRFNELVIIPNNKLAKEQIKNLSRPSRIHAELVTIGFSYKDNPIKVKAMLLEIAEKTEGILNKPQALPLTISYDDFYITYGVKFFVRDFDDLLLVKDNLMTEIYDAAKLHGLTIPYPIREIILKDGKINQ